MVKKHPDLTLTALMRKVLTGGNDIAVQHQKHITPTDVLSAAVKDPDTRGIVQGMGIDPKALEDGLKNVKDDGSNNSAVKNLLRKAGEKTGQVDVQGFINAMVTTHGGVAGKLLMQLGLNPGKMLGSKAQGFAKEVGGSELSKATDNLNIQAKAGLIGKIIGRDDEVRTTIEILCRHTKNNVLFIGDNGVGKTAIVEAVAALIVSGDVPDSLKDKTILNLRVGDLSGGTSLRGELEAKITKIIEEIKDRKNIILYIDNIQTLVGQGAGIAELIKPALYNGTIKCIGTASIEEAKKFNKDRSMSSRFETIDVAAPTVDETVSILRGIKNRYEEHHKVHILDQALVAAAKLSNRYITDRFLPAKAIDLLDQACASLKCSQDMEPRSIHNLRKAIDNKNNELKSLNNEKGTDVEESRTRIRNSITELNEQLQSKLGHWANEKLLVSSLVTINMNMEIETDPEELSALSARRESILAELKESRRTETFIREEVSEADIGTVISRMTGIPLENMDSDMEKLLNMDNRLSKSVIGQRAAIAAISSAIRRSRAGLGDGKRPIGSFIFLGPTGTGKTELAKALSTFLFDDPDSMVRLDMSEFQGKETVNKMLGSPAGYAGAEEGGMLTEAVMRHPYSVVLLDEIDKAHKDIFDLLLQVLDDGHLTDGKGRRVDFTNTVIIMTSNIGARHVQDGEVTPEVIKDVRSDLEARFRPEFLNRFDDIVVFHRLGREHIAQIVNIQLAGLHKRLAEKKMTLVLSEEAIDLICERGYDPAFGARPLKRAVQDLVQNTLSTLILSGQFKAGDSIEMVREGDKLVVKTS